MEITKEIIDEILELFKKRNFEEGYKKLCEYNCECNKMGGLNFDWNEALKDGLLKSDKKVLKWFANKTIVCKSNIDVEKFKAIMCYAYLSGNSYQNTIKIIRNIYGIEIELSDLIYFNTMLSCEREAIELEDVDEEYYMILDSEGSCEKCFKRANKKMKLSDRKIGVNFPPLCDKCRCTIIGCFDD